MSSAPTETQEPAVVPGYASPHPERRDYQRQSLVIALGWLLTNLGLQVATLPLRFVLKDEVQLGAAALSSFFVIGHFTNYVKPLAGVMTDSIPLCGTRRRHYLLFSLLSTGIFWVLLSLVPRSYAWMLPLYTVMYVGVVFTSTTLGGVMVEAGNHFRAAGRFTAQRVTMFKIADILGGPIGGFLAKLPFTVAASVGAALHLALIPFLMRNLPKEPKATLDTSAWTEVKRQGQVLIRSRTLLGAAAMIFLLAASPGMNTPLLFYQTNQLHFGKEFVGILAMVGAIAGMLTAIIYYPLCSRVSLRTLVASSIVLHTLGGLCYLAYRSPETAILITAINGATNTMAMLPVYDIALRATPKGSEAIGYAVMMSMWNLTNAVSDLTGSFIFERLCRSAYLGPLVWIDAATTLVVILAVPFMPKALSTKESALVK
jgi:predicted MFS family arabinose efflux permease